MRRTALLFAALLAAGCGETAPERPRSEPRAAGPQRVELGWREPYPARTGNRLLFEVESFEVTAAGWAAEIAITNSTQVAFEARPPRTERRYGVMLFASGDPSELEDASRSGSPPPVREATKLEPPPPAAIAPGATWRSRISAPGALAAGSYLRVVFGPLRADGETPPGLKKEFVWITDRSYRLRP